MCPMLNYDVQFPETHADDIFRLIGAMLLQEMEASFTSDEQRM